MLVAGDSFTVLLGSGGLLGFNRASQRNRWDTRRLQLEVLEKELDLRDRTANDHRDLKSTAAPSSEEVARSPQALAVNIQSLIVRFILLVLALVGWNILLGFVLGLVAIFFPSFSFYALAQLLGEWADQPGDVIFRNLDILGDAVIFIVLGRPLLADIIGSNRSFLDLTSIHRKHSARDQGDSHEE